MYVNECAVLPVCTYVSPLFHEEIIFVALDFVRTFNTYSYKSALG